MLIPTHQVLLICDEKFNGTVKDLDTFKEKFFEFVTGKNENKNVIYNTVSGNYGFSGIESVLSIEDKNKTAFIKTTLNHVHRINEVFIITNSLTEAFLEGLKSQLNDMNKPLSIFSYEVKDNGSSKT